jgi:hypothetical protein
MFFMKMKKKFDITIFSHSKILSEHYRHNPLFNIFFPKSKLGFQFWTFIFVHFSKPNLLSEKHCLLYS